MRKTLIVLQIAGSILLLAGLYVHNDLLLAIAAVIMATCVVINFRKGLKRPFR